MIRYVAFGVVIDDIILADGTTMRDRLGGGGPQTAWGMAAALGEGGEVGIAAAVGADCTDALLAPLLRAGIDVSGLLRGAPATPRAWQRFSAAGERSHLWQVAPPPGETVYQAALKALPPHYRTARAMHWGLHPENPTLARAREFGAGGAIISLETFRPPERPLGAEALRDLVTACTVFSPSWGEASAMIGSADAASVVCGFRAAGGQVLVLRRAEQGADVWDFRGGGLVGLHVPAVPVEVVDLTGAGNAFAGAFLARLDDGIASAAAHGAAAASFMLEQFGMPNYLPDPQEFARRVTWAQGRQSRLIL